MKKKKKIRPPFQEQSSQNFKELAMIKQDLRENT